MDNHDSVDKLAAPPEIAIKRVRELNRELSRHNYLYHTLDAPEISDDQYDALFNELVGLESLWPALRHPDSPTLKTGGSILPSLEKKRHTLRMYGLDNVFSEQEWLAFLERMERAWDNRADGDLQLDFWCDCKLDGLAIELLYENGLLVQALTRGDGETGEVVTQAVRTIRNLPLSFLGDGPFPSRIEIRGEVVIFKKDFQSLNAQREQAGEKIFSNPRNAAAGAVRQLDISITASRPLRFCAYSFGSADWGQVEPCLMQSQAASLFRSWGFDIPPAGKLCHDSREVAEHVERIRLERASFPMEIDGVVAKLDALDAQAALGFTARAPRFAVAFKFPAIKASTRLLAIDVQVGRTGALTPVAILKPVPVGGVVVSRATLHNEAEIKALDLRVGDTVLIQRAGDVIPEIVGVDLSQRQAGASPYEFPKMCPACGQPVHREPDEAAWRCDNLACPAICLRALLHFVSKAGLDVQGIGEKWITQLVNSGKVHSPADLFELSVKDLADFERMGPTLAKKFVNALATAKNTATLPRFLSALGIRHVGEQTAKLLAEVFPDMDQLASANIEALQMVRDIGPEVAASIRFFFETPANAETLRRLKNLGLWPVMKKRAVPAGTLAGKTVLFTGTLAIARQAAGELAEKAGVAVKNSIGKNLDFLVAGSNPGSKLQKAQQLGIKIIDEQEFYKLLKENGISIPESEA